MARQPYPGYACKVLLLRRFSNSFKGRLYALIISNIIIKLTYIL